jgi:tetratricopeptide (TPR) repeat protein
LGAGTIVTGTVAQAGDVIRVGVRMENAKGEQFASDEITASRNDIFALQDSLAETVALWLRTEIGTELGQVRLRASTSVVAAWERVQQGQQTAAGANVLLASNDLDGAARQLAKADSLFADAEALDPGWPEPASRRGWLAYRQSRLGGMDRDHYVEWIDRGVSHAERALAISPGYADALELRGTLLYWNSLLNLGGSPEESDRLKRMAEEDFNDAIGQDPTRASALTTLSHLLLSRGEVAIAKLKALDAYKADPFLENANLTLWRIFTASFSLQDGFEARNYCAEGVRRFPDDFRFAQCQLMLMGIPGEEVDIPRAWSLVDVFAEKSPPQNREVNRYRGYMYVGTALARKAVTSEATTRQQLTDSARSVLIRGRASTDVDPLRETALLESIGRNALGDGEEAVRQLSIYLAANPGEMAGYRSGAAAGDVPWYHKALLQEPRFRALVGQR